MGVTFYSYVIILCALYKSYICYFLFSISLHVSMIGEDRVHEDCGTEVVNMVKMGL